MTEEQPGRLGIFSTENQDREIGDRFTVGIPMKKEKMRETLEEVDTILTEINTNPKALDDLW